MQIETAVHEEQFAVYNSQFSISNHLQRVNRPCRFEFHQLPKHPWRNYFHQPTLTPYRLRESREIIERFSK